MFSKNCIVLTVTFRSMTISRQFLNMRRVLKPLFACQYLVVPCIHLLKSLFFPPLNYLVENQLTVNKRVCFSDSQFIDLCVFLYARTTLSCCFVVSSEIRRHESLNCVLFQIYLRPHTSIPEVPSGSFFFFDLLITRD